MSSSPSIKAPPTRTTPLPPPSAGSPSVVYGDSTSFPYEGNFVETIRHATDCTVALLAAEHVIVRAAAAVVEVDRNKHLERSRLEAMHGTIKRTLANEMTPAQMAPGGPAAERILRGGARILDAARVAIDGEIVSLEATANAEISRARKAAEEARASAHRAIEAFLLLHDLPGSEITLRMTAEEERYVTRAHALTPFGVEANFTIQIPEAHQWGHVCRVADLTPGTEVHVPLESGLFFKKVAVQPVKLDRLFVSAVHVSVTHGTLTLRKQPTSGAGYKLDFDRTKERAKVLIARLSEDGMESPDPVQELEGDDAVHVLRLWQRVLDSTEELGHRRQAMTEGTVDGQSIRDFDQPKVIAEELVSFLAPIVREISQRSGAPGELVLRRDVRAGRREEIYLTKAELMEKVLTLPPALRGVFGGFELESPRSPRAPAPSLPAYEEMAAPDQSGEVCKTSGSAIEVAVA